MRAGIGVDAHPFAPGRPLVLGGVTIPFDRGLEGHSDADVVIHAVIDALLGAAGLGDIGTHFPPGDPRWAGAEGSLMLARVAEMIGRAGFRVANVDVVAIAERPPLAPHRAGMEQGIAAGLGIEASRVSVKATTTDSMGFTGRGEGIAALAVTLLEEIPAAPASDLASESSV